MRTGFNPNRRAPLPAPPPFIASVITHLPSTEGYHEQRLEIVQLCLNSMRENAETKPYIMIFDNGSCPALTDWLYEDYKPDTLILSPNIGKFSARAAIFRQIHPGIIISCSDDDIYYYPGWDTAQLGILHTYPNVGVVSGYPVRTQFRWAIDSNMSWAEEMMDLGDHNFEIEHGRFIPDEYERDFAISIGRDPDFQLGEYTKDDEDIKFRYNDIEAYATSHHCQFLGYAGRLAPLTTWDGLATTDEREGWDHKIDDAGLLRLCTIKRYTQHIGNILEPELRLIAEEAGLL